MADICQTNNEPLSVANPASSAPNQSIINNDTKGITSGIGNTGSYFNVNTIAAAGAQTYNAINGVINEMFGYDFKWFRAVPQQRSKDVIFQEYTLYNVEECPLDIKAVVPSGQVPDSKYTYDLMGLEYEVPFELQIDKIYWESKAGFGTAPQKKDIVYFPMSNKLYQVESSYLFRGFMEQETAWKINLRKYMPESSRREGNALKDTIDVYTVSTEEIFGGAIKADIDKLVDDKQMSAMNGTTQDKYKTYDSELKTISNSLNIYGTIIAQSFYDMQTPLWFNAITYNDTDIISKTSDRSMMAWINPQVSITTPKEHDIKEITSIVTFPDVSSFDPSIGEAVDASIFSSANYTITLNSTVSLSEIQIDDNVVISRAGALNFYAKIVAISVNPLTYYCIINPFVLEDLQGIKSNWASQKGYKLQVKNPICILDGVNDFEEHVLSVNIFANQYIAINYGHTYANDDAYVVRLDDKLNDNEWYGIVVNIGNTWGQYNVYVWKKHETDKNIKLQNIFYETLRLYPEDIAINNYTINKSPSYLTNIRLFNATIEEERQINELLSYFSKDGDQLIVSDAAEPIMHLEYISKQR